MLGGPDLPTRAELAIVSVLPQRPGESFDDWFTRRVLQYHGVADVPDAIEEDWQDHVDRNPHVNPSRPILRNP